MPVAERGYGNALMGGIAAARGTLRDHGRRRRQLRLPGDPEVRRASCARGTTSCRAAGCPRGGGRDAPGAMPLAAPLVGQPDVLVRWRGAGSTPPIHDVYCGLRGFTKEHYERLDQRCTGMEFATEMIIKASLYAAQIAEVPITLHPDGRKAHAPHLRTFRDGWRTLRFFLMYSPRWLFLIPGMLLVLLGLLGYALAMPRRRVGRRDVRRAHAAVREPGASSAATRRSCSRSSPRPSPMSEGLMPPDRRLERFVQIDHARARADRRRLGLRRRRSCCSCVAVERVAGRGLRRARLREHDAAGGPRRDADGARLPDDPVELLRQRPGDAPAVDGRRRVRHLRRELRAALEQGIRLSGEDSTYFAEGRVEWLGGASLSWARRHAVLDFGCGTGTAMPYLFTLPGAEQLVGVDISRGVAGRRVASTRSERGGVPPQRDAGSRRPRLLQRCLPPHSAGGPPRGARSGPRGAAAGRPLRALGEQPVEPGDAAGHARIPFDRDAEPFAATHAQRMLTAAGLEVVRTDHLFVFPNFARRSAPWSRDSSASPIGAQYLVLAREPSVIPRGRRTI